MIPAAAHQSWVELCEELAQPGAAVDLSIIGVRASEAEDALFELLDAVVHSEIGRRRVPDVVVELLAALRDVAAQQRISASGNGPGGAATIDLVTREWLAPREAGAVVGLTGSRIRQLVRSGVVAHRRTGERGYLVSLDSVREYLGRPA